MLCSRRPYLLAALLVGLLGLTLTRADEAAKEPAKVDPATDKIDWDRATKLHQRSQAGETLSAEDQAYYERAKAAYAAGQRPGAHQPAGQPPAGGIDWTRATLLRQREQRGEKLSPEDQAYLDRAKAAHGAGQGAGDHPPAGQPPTGGHATVGFKPLTEMTATDSYKGQDGGLYGGGRNTPPEALRQRALQAAAAIRPLDAAGQPAANGRIGLVSVGMSNTTQEFQAFLALANADHQKSPLVALVDGAQGARAAAAWADSHETDRHGVPSVWVVLDQRLQAAGVTARQVQVAWIKQADANPSANGEFPAHSNLLAQRLTAIVTQLHQHCPNLKLVYLSSRIYAGFATTQLNPEPYAYEGAFAVRSVIQAQSAAGPALLWGPYLWGDGATPRAADHLIWQREDFGPDGTHPSPAGRQKVAQLLLNFLRTDETAKPWFLTAGAAH